MSKKLIKFSFSILAFSLMIVTPLAAVWAHQSEQLHEEPSGPSNVSAISEPAVVYYNEACGMCAHYVNSALPEILAQNGITEIVKKDYVNERSNRLELNDRLNQLSIPFNLQSHIMTFVGDKYILAGHVPKQIVESIFEENNASKFKRIIVYQDEMSENVANYQVLAVPLYADEFVGEAQTNPINEPVDQYLDYLLDNQDELIKETSSETKGLGSFLSLVLFTGFLDGFNPCAFAVMIFFIAFLFTLQRSIGHIFKLGVVYIVVIYLTYLAIGLGILKAIVFSGSPHLMAKIGAWLVIGLGLINIKDFIAPKLPIHLRIPKFSQNTLKYWLTKATLPAVIVAAFLVGLCTFPCSGGIYVAIIGLLATRGTFWTGLGYLLVYNVMFVLPLVLLLILAGNKLTLGKVAKWQSENDTVVKMLIGLSMIVIGAVILIFFV